MPKDAIGADELTAHIKKLALEQLERAKPHDADELAAFRKEYKPIWQQTLGLEIPGKQSVGYYDASGRVGEGPSGAKTDTPLELGRVDHKDRIAARMFTPANGKPATSIVLVAQGGMAAYLTSTGAPGPLVEDRLVKEW